MTTFQTNVIGPLLMMKHFSSFLPSKRQELDKHDEVDHGLPNHAVWLNMSARVGSITDNSLGGWYSYRASKAGLNSATKTFDLWLKQKLGHNAMAIAYHPGTVKTDLSKDFWSNVKPEKLFSPDFAVQKMLDVVRHKSLEARGRCWAWDGKEIMP